MPGLWAFQMRARQYPLIGSLDRQGHPATFPDSGNGLLRYAVACMTRSQTKRRAARHEARRPRTTVWCDQISTPAENQLRFTVPGTDTVLLRLSLVSTNRHVADRSPLPERRGN